ncbi:MAG TPA: hypothetical protein PKA16_02265 [Ottowia sp.]|uniref:hypothetical protein n=1 Tax=Ottowia sp. TaxID=1898956 RepID=UPI002C0B02DF|nr:hypothetical protein [Ottowia sp.]HMN20196.1 hypothetical protein [Ottowia sp.]
MAPANKNAPELQPRGVKQTTTKRHHFNSTGDRFQGTDNPRHLRAIAALLRRPISRQELDSRSGAANGPDLVAELRARGLEVPCQRIRFIDRDGRVCRPGVYSFTAVDRRKVYQWQARKGAA